jgi:DNA-directed RNA polymerase alpha subunit
MHASYISFSVVHLSFTKRDAVRYSQGVEQQTLPDVLPPGNGPLRRAATSTQETAMRPDCACNIPIPERLFSAKTYNALLRSRITTIKQLCALELADLKWLRSFGKKAEQEVIAYRARISAPLKEEA